jgi:hypothetical protein
MWCGVCCYVAAHRGAFTNEALSSFIETTLGVLPAASSQSDEPTPASSSPASALKDMSSLHSWPTVSQRPASELPKRKPKSSDKKKKSSAAAPKADSKPQSKKAKAEAKKKAAEEPEQSDVSDAQAEAEARLVPLSPLSGKQVQVCRVLFLAHCHAFCCLWCGARSERMAAEEQERAPQAATEEDQEAPAPEEAETVRSPELHAARTCARLSVGLVWMVCCSFAGGQHRPGRWRRWLGRRREALINSILDCRFL